jgi:phosphoribosylaminoimidazole-succinocarboxamide synthase
MKIYEGSVKNLWKIESGLLEFEYTDAFSVFDWGRMPDELLHKGESLAALGAFFFESVGNPKSWMSVRASKWIRALEQQRRFWPIVDRELSVLERDGLCHHYLERSGSNRIRVREAKVFHPEKRVFGGQTLYQYSSRLGSEGATFIPLEVIFRFGMPKGSSLTQRLTPEYSRTLGFQQMPAEGKMFLAPVFEFFSKLEATDRFLDWEKALQISGLKFDQFERLAARTLCLAVWLSAIFERSGLELWDGKFEWALINGDLALVDSIGPDELRLIDSKSGAQISKEFLRAFYRATPWFSAVERAKEKAKLDASVDWKAEVLREVGEPPSLTGDYREVADALYPSLALAITGENPGGRGLPLPKLLERMAKCRP